MAKINRVLISVSNKENIVEFAKQLQKYTLEIISTGNTAKILKENGIDVINISDYTGFPEMLDGRLKTLHPKIHGGLLGIRDNQEHMKIMEEQGIKPIDMVVVNLYPFEDIVAKEDCTLEKAIENIDIGGPTMLRSAAKNYKFVSVVTHPSQYDSIISEIEETQGTISEETNYDLALKVFEHTCKYDGVIAEYLSKGNFKNIVYNKIQDLRYGENPHQKAVYYDTGCLDEVCVSNAKKLNGKELSFNNIIDLDAALEIIKEFGEKPFSVIIKHTNPCGAAEADSLIKAYTLAKSVDPISAFGSIIGFNRQVDRKTAEEIITTFIEAVIAPGYDQDALELLKTKKNLRILDIGDKCRVTRDHKEKDMKKVVGGLLIQDRDLGGITPENLQIVTNKKPTQKEMNAMLFAWRVVKHVKSNAIVYSYENHIIGVGSGQMSRLDSTKIGALKSNYDVQGSVMASDAFFPFRDNIDKAVEVGVKAIIQSGGSVRDKEVIDACNEHGIAMVFTGMRHFKH